MIQEIVGTRIHFESFVAGLQPRSHSLNSADKRAFYYLVVQQEGHSVIRCDEQSHTLQSASVAVISLNSSAKLDMRGGSQLWLIGFDEALRSMIIGNEVDGPKIKQLLQQPSLLSLSANELERTFIPLIQLFESEIKEDKKRSLVILSSLLRVLLLQSHRVLQDHSSVTSESNDEILVQQFQQLIEVCFKQRAPLTYYCEQMNLTYDRLHDVCRRALGKTPKELLSERTLMDAIYRLKKLPDSIQTISNDLGFSDSSQFSHFFKKRVGCSPKQYRQQQKVSLQSALASKNSDFSDWP